MVFGRLERPRQVMRPAPVRLPRPLGRGTAAWRCASGGSGGIDPERLRAGACWSSPAALRRVVVVDDDPAIRMVCRFNLVAAGVEVLEAGDGGEALELLRREQVDLVLLDVMMPGRDGWEVARELAGSVPIVFLTARAEDVDRRQAVELGAVGYVVKPFDPVVLASELERILVRLERGEQRQLQDEILRGSR